MDAPTHPYQEFPGSPGIVMILDAEGRTWLKVKDAIHRVPYPSMFTAGAIKLWKAVKGET